MNSEPLTLNRLHEMWSQEPRWRKLAGTTLQASLAVFLREHGDAPVSRCTAATMSIWLDETQAGASDTVLALSCLRNLFRWAKEQRLAAVNPDDIQIDADTFNAKPATAPRPESRNNGLTESRKSTRGGRNFWPGAQARLEHPTEASAERSPRLSMPSRVGCLRRTAANNGNTETRKRGPKNNCQLSTVNCQLKKSVNPSIRDSVKSVGSRVKRAAEKALRQDFKERFSSKWIGKSIGRVLDHQKEPGKAKMKTGRRAPGGTAYTDSQHTIRNTAKGMGYRVGDATRSDERLIIYVTPEARRSALRERTWARHGFTLCHADGTPAAPLERQGYDEVKGALVYRLKKRGFTFDGTRVTVPAGLQLNPRTERALRWKGFAIIEH